MRRITVALAIALTVACATPTPTSTPTPAPAPGIDLSRVKEDAVKALYDASGRMRNPDREVQSISRENAGGFGGFYFDEDDPTVAYVYMKDITETAAAETAFRAAYAKDSEITRIVPVQTDHSLDELVDWLYDGVNALERAGIETASAGMRILDNRFAVNVTNENQMNKASVVLDAMGVPRSAYELGAGKWEALPDRD